MSVNSYLQYLGSELVLRFDEKSHISNSISFLKDRLSSYFGCDIKEIKLYGSYARETILPRKVDENSDVDIMVIFNNSSEYKPQTFLNKLKEFAEKYYFNSVIHQSNPTIVLELNHIKFELTPAFISNSLYYIPKNPSEWMWTDPDGFNSSLTNCNKMNDYKVKPIIRILKYWNINKNYRDLKSFELETKLTKRLLLAYLYCTSYTDYLKYALSDLKYYTNDNRINTAISSIDKALQFEREGYSYSALIEIKKIFPEVK